MRHPPRPALLALVAALWAAPALAGGPVWRDLPSGLAEAKRTGKDVLVDVYTDWCGWCKRMDRDTYADAAVQAQIDKHFVPVKLDAESSKSVSYDGRSRTYAAIAQDFGVSGYPTTVFLRSDGSRLTVLPGYLPAARFQLVLRYIGEDQMAKGVKWKDFEAANGGTPAAR